MNDKFAKISLFIVSLVLAGSPVITLAATPTLPRPITKTDISEVGFTEVTPQGRVGERFLSPTYYFKVKETVAKTNPEWASASNVVAVLIVPIADKSWLYNDGKMQVIEYAGRTQARVSSPGKYIVVTGPDRNKVMTLANNLQVLY